MEAIAGASSSTSRSTRVAPAGARAIDRHRRHPHHVSARRAAAARRARRRALRRRGARRAGAGRRGRGRPAGPRRRRGRPRAARARRVEPDDRRRVGLDDGRRQPAPGRQAGARHDDRAAERLGQHPHLRAALRERDPQPVRRRLRRERRAVPRARVLRRSRHQGRRSGASAARGGCSTCSRQMGLVVFSVGSADSRVPSRVYAGGYLEPADRADLAADGVVGDVATVFYRAGRLERRHPPERARDRAGTSMRSGASCAGAASSRASRRSRACAARSRRGSSPTWSSTRRPRGLSRTTRRASPRHRRRAAWRRAYDME